MRIEDKEYEIIEEYSREYYYYALIKNNSEYFFLKKINNNDSLYINALNNEIAILNSIDSDKIPHIISSKENEYIIYRFVDGNLLKNYSNIDLKNILLIIISLLKILFKVHKAGYVHNDLKAGNIIIGKDGMVYLMDFGNATKIGEAPKFCSPDISSYELISKQTVDNRSDIYSIGVLLYELITHTNPFEGLVGRKLYAAKTKCLPHLKVDSLIGKQLDYIIQKSTVINIDNRYSDVGEMGNDINEVLEELKISNVNNAQ